MPCQNIPWPAESEGNAASQRRPKEFRCLRWRTVRLNTDDPPLGAGACCSTGCSTDWSIFIGVGELDVPGEAADGDDDDEMERIEVG